MPPHSDHEHPIKKVFMVLMWRTQQIGQPTSLVLLVIQLALIVNLYVGWRFTNAYVGIILVLAALTAAILMAGYAWDRRLQMWHEQNVVMIERNPYAMHKLTPKEIVQFKTLWVPFFTAYGGEMTKTGVGWDKWCEDQMAKDPALRASVEELTMRYFADGPGLTDHRSV